MSKIKKIIEDEAVLVALVGPLNGQRFYLNNGVILVGRGSDCTINIPDRQVSRYHARISTKKEGIFIEDLGSKNGTHCNGELVQVPCQLKDGDLIQIALIQQFTFLTSDATLPLNEKDQSDKRLFLNARSRSVVIAGRVLEPPLSALQFQVLQFLYQNSGRVVDRQELVTKAWTNENAYGVSDEALDALLRRLRERLASIDPEFIYIVTIRGHGVRFDNPPQRK